MMSNPGITRGHSLESGYLTKAQFATSAMRGMIRRGDLAPGQRLDLEALGERMNMSATPIREALRVLEAEGLVTNEPHHGIRVVDFSLDDAVALYDLRALLEAHATGLATPLLSDSDLTELERLGRLQSNAVKNGDVVEINERNEDLHFYIYRAAAQQSPYLLDFISRLWNAFPWTTAWMVPPRAARSTHDHADIISAIRGGDADLASRRMHEHIIAGKTFVLDRLTSDPATLNDGRSSAPARDRDEATTRVSG
jgi:DNA-binding GntR family transcriptional regulator